MVPPKAINQLKARNTSAHRRLNDLIIGTEIAVGGLDVFAGLEDVDDPFTILLPHRKGKLIKISRSREKLKIILEQQINYKQYEKSLIFAVAEAEDHIASYIRIVLRAYPDRLTRGPRGGQSDKSVTWGEIIQTDSKESLIDSIIEDRINSIMRNRPSEYLKYLGRIIEGHLPEQAIDRFCELCATRDLIVHSQGKISSEYITKAAGLERGKIGDLAVVDEKYFRSAMSYIKDIYREIYAV
jgi:hypothetical protein